MDLQYITDNQGHKNGVLLSLSDWNKIQKDLEELKALRNKKAFFTGLKEAFSEVKLIKEGKKKANSFDDLLNEL
jgi:PHD/YefM family antitoxin component YafN of YafNO toxin-antitoxin module